MHRDIIIFCWVPIPGSTHLLKNSKPLRYLYQLSHTPEYLYKQRRRKTWHRTSSRLSHYLIFSETWRISLLQSVWNVERCRRQCALAVEYLAVFHHVLCAVITTALPSSLTIIGKCSITANHLSGSETTILYFIAVEVVLSRFFLLVVWPRF